MSDQALSQERTRAVGWRVFVFGDDGMLRAPWVNYRLGSGASEADWPERQVTARVLIRQPSGAGPGVPLRSVCR